MNIYEILNKYDNIVNRGISHSSVQIMDNSVIMIENCRQICVFNENEIRLRLAKNDVIIVGLELKMRNYNRTGVEIKGRIHSISFDNEREK